MNSSSTAKSHSLGPNDTAYDLAVRKGFSGTETDWLNSLSPHHVQRTSAKTMYFPNREFHIPSASSLPPLYYPGDPVRTSVR